MGINSVIYKKIIIKKSSQGRSSSWLWSLSPQVGLGLCLVMFSRLGELVLVLVDGTGSRLS